MIETAAVTPALLLTIMFFIASVLYASVGHAGASAYLAAMALAGMQPAVMKPTALVLNILVAAIATVKFYRAGAFSWRNFWPFACTSVPFAFIGGRIMPAGHVYKMIVGVVLIYSAYRIFVATFAVRPSPIKALPRLLAIAAGSVIGFVSGLTGVGGGIFLSPLLLLMNWAETRQASGIAAAFILVNSISGFIGSMSKAGALPGPIPVWAVAVMAGGWIGAEYGSRSLNNMTIRRLLSVVLVIAGLKLILV